MTGPVTHLDYFRTRWETRLVDSVIVKESSGSVFDPDTGEITPSYTELYDGPGLVRPASAGEAEFGEAEMATYDYIVFVPHTEIDLYPGHIIDVTSTHDGALDGLSLVVNNVSRDTYITVRRLDCTEIQNAG